MPSATTATRAIMLATAILVLAASLSMPEGDVAAASPQAATVAEAQPQSLRNQSQADVDRKSAGCLSCHKPDANSMHERPVQAGCVDCHGGDATASVSPASVKGSQPYADTKRRAHVPSRLDIWPESGANPVRAFAQTNEESLEFIRFVNPGDLRAAGAACGSCHEGIVNRVGKSMMRHGGMLWGAALYNNGSFPFKNYQFGEFYMPDGTAATAFTVPPPTARDVIRDGVLPFLQPLFRWDLSQPGNVLRVFERGGRRPIEVGIPDPDEEPGRPANRLSNRGLGTLNRTDPVFIGLQKTRLLDPTLNFFGTNDQPGDYRSSGCTACHVVYANDRSPVHSGSYASAGNNGTTQTSDPVIAKDEPGHPLKHVMTRAIPTSQCMVCHIHPGTNMVNSYLGFMWWDNETDGARMYPPSERRLSGSQRAEIESRNPEGSALRGLWSDLAFLRRTGEPAFNAQLTQTQFADFHGHGWMFRAVFKRDRKGNLLDERNAIVPSASAEQLARAVARTGREQRPGEPVHLKDIHLERGMHCVDCHFNVDAHGDGKLYGETRNAIEIACVDCHGTTRAAATLKTSGFAAPSEGTDLSIRITPFQNVKNRDERQPQFVFRDDLSPDNPPIEQHSMVTPGLSWTIPQIVDSVNPKSSRYNPLAARAKTITKDGTTWGTGAPDSQLAHSNERFTCQTCHTSWMTSCFGCHLSQKANVKTPMLHNEGTDTRNWTSYNFQVLRDDVFMLGIDGTVTGNRISPVRSSSAVVVSSEGASRQLVYHQQQTVSAEGYSGQAFNPHVPHTVRKNGDENVQRLSYLPQRRQQRMARSIAPAGHELRQLLWATCLCRYRRGRHRGRRGDRTRGASGGDR